MRVVTMLAVLTALAFGHTSTLESGGFVSGFLHPISGLDHILAMIGVGLVAFFAVSRGYMALVAFMSAMVLAAIAGYNGFSMFSVEEGILLSIAVVFGLIGFANRLSINTIIAIVAFFGMFHGFAHGSEFTTGNFITYIFGFSTSTLILHITGITLGYIYYKRTQQTQIAK